jgi:hypothetical protein
MLVSRGGGVLLGLAAMKPAAEVRWRGYDRGRHLPRSGAGSLANRSLEKAAKLQGSGCRPKIPPSGRGATVKIMCTEKYPGVQSPCVDGQ